VSHKNYVYDEIMFDKSENNFFNVTFLKNGNGKLRAVKLA